MKMLATLLALAVATQAVTHHRTSSHTNTGSQISYRPGGQYRYNYRALTATGVPLGSNDRAGIALWTDVLVVPQPGNQILIQLENPVIRELNSDKPGDFWSQGRIPEVSDRPEDFTSLLPEVETTVVDQLKRPVLFTLGIDGIVRDLKVYEDEPEWIFNIKKAVVNQFQIQRIQQEVQQKTEDTIIGSGCRVNYDMMKPTEDNLYEITKDYTHTSCDQLARFRGIIGASGRLMDKQDDIVTTSFVSKLTTSLIENRHVLKKCISEGRFTLRPFSPEFGEIVTYTRQEFEFVKAEPKTAKVPSTLVKRYSGLFAGLVDRQNPITDVYSYEHLLTEQQKLDMIKQLLSTIVIDMTRQDQPWKAEEQTGSLMHMIHLLRGLKEKNSFVQLVNFCIRPEHQDKMRPVIVSAFAHCGAPALVQTFPQLLKDNLLTPVELGMIVTAIPSTHMPTYDVIKTLKAVYTMPACGLRMKEQILLTIGSLTHGICKEVQLGQIDPSVVCTSQMKTELIKFFTEQYTLARDDVEKIVILRAIGNSGLDMTNFLKTLIFDENLSLELRESAIIAMRRCYDLDKLVQTLLPVFRHEKSTFPAELRIVAFTTLLERVPTVEMLTKLTAHMNQEKCRQVGNFVYSYLRNMIEMPTIFEPTKELVTAAQNILPNIRRFEDGVMFSKNVKFLIASLSRRMAKLISVDVLNVHSQFMPRAMVFRIWDFCSGYYADMLQAGFRFEGLDKLVQQVFEIIGIKKGNTNDMLTTLMGDRYRRDLTHIQNLLNEDEIVNRPIEETRGFLFLRYFGNEIGIFHTDRYTLSDITTSLSSLSSLREPLRYFNMVPVAPTMTVKIQSPVGMPFVGHYHTIAVFDVKTNPMQQTSQQNGLIVGRNFMPRLMVKMTTRVGTDFGLIKSFIGQDAHMKLSLPLSLLVTRDVTGQMMVETWLDTQTKTPVDKTMLEMFVKPIVNFVQLSPAHLGCEEKLRDMIVPLVDNVVFYEKEFSGLKLKMQTRQEGLTFRLPLFPLCGRHLFQLQWTDVRQAKPFGVKAIADYDLSNWKYELQMLWNPRIPTETQQLNLKLDLVRKNPIGLPMLGLEIEPKWTGSVYRYFATIQVKSGKVNPAMSWIEAGEERKIELIIKGQFGEGIQYDPHKDDILIKTTIGKCDLQSDLEFLDTTIETSDCYKCEQNMQESWRNVYCDRCIFKRSWLSQLDTKIFLNKEKTLKMTNLPMTLFTQWFGRYLNVWESKFGLKPTSTSSQLSSTMTSSLLTSEHTLLSQTMSHLNTAEDLIAARVVCDVHPYLTEKNVTIYYGEDKIVLSRIPIIPAFRRLDNLKINRVTDVATDRVFMPNFGLCSLDGLSQLQTLDALREKVPVVTECEQLLVKDCTKERRFEITTKLVQGKRFLKVLLGEILLEIQPTGDSYKILINNKPHEFSNGKIVTPQFWINLENVMTPQNVAEKKIILIVKDEMIKSTLIGDFVNVQVPFWLKDQVCGLCGDFNGEVVRDLRMPDRSPAQTLQQFLETYTSLNCGPHSSRRN